MEARRPLTLQRGALPGSRHLKEWVHSSQGDFTMEEVVRERHSAAVRLSTVTLLGPSTGTSQGAKCSAQWWRGARLSGEKDRRSRYVDGACAFLLQYRFQELTRE